MLFIFRTFYKINKPLTLLIYYIFFKIHKFLYDFCCSSIKKKSWSIKDVLLECICAVKENDTRINKEKYFNKDMFHDLMDFTLPFLLISKLYIFKNVGISLSNTKRIKYVNF